jgi:hypothetical protein
VIDTTISMNESIATLPTQPSNTQDHQDGRRENPVGEDPAVVIDDYTRANESSACEQEGVAPLLSYHAFPAIPAWLQPYVTHLQVVFPVFPRPLPDHWLNASVAEWK